MIISTERVVQLSRKAVFVTAFLAFLCIPVGGSGVGGGHSSWWAPMFLIYFGGYSLFHVPVTAFRVCVTIAAYDVFKLASNKDKANGPIAGFRILVLLSISFVFLLWEMYPPNKPMTAVFIATLFVCGLLAICDALTLRWLVKRNPKDSSKMNAA